MRKVLIINCVLASALLSACSIPGLYRQEIQQGNVVTQESLDQLELGMDKRKVLFVMGTPLLMDTFNQDRWDYYYSIKKGAKAPQHRRITLFFVNERLSHIEGDVKPASGERGPPPRKDTLVTVPDPPPEGIFGRMANAFRDTGTPPAAAAATAGAAAAGDEPPPSPAEDIPPANELDGAPPASAE